MSWSNPRRRTAGTAAAVVAAAVLAGCADQPAPAEPIASPAFSQNAPAPPLPVVPVTIGGLTVGIWPFTGIGLHPLPSDPINLIFPGTGDPRVIRAALVGLNGDRTMFGLPPVPPFDCTWADAVGTNQTAWTADAGWAGSAIQLECGDYGPMRAHLRMFPAGAWTIANAHFEVLIPGTQAHEVLSWEFAERIVMFDLIRSGLLTAPVSQTQLINPAPFFRFSNPVVFNQVPVPLRAALGLPIIPQPAPVPIPNDGFATILHTGPVPPPQPGVLNNDFVIEFNQMIPKPFCSAGPGDYLHVTGPIQFRQRVVVTPSGNYISQFQGNGRLTLQPVNPLTGAPAGDAFSAVVNEHYRNIVTNNVTLVSNVQMQVMLPPNAPFRGRLHATLLVGPGGSTHESLRIDCY